MGRRIEAVHVVRNLLREFFDKTIILQREAENFVED
jgi:hypothetical protein